MVPRKADLPFFGGSATLRDPETKSRRPPEAAVCATPFLSNVTPPSGMKDSSEENVRKSINL